MKKVQYNDQGVRVLQYLVNYKARFNDIIGTTRTIRLFDDLDFQIAQRQVGSTDDLIFATAEQADEIFNLLGINFEVKRATAFTTIKTKLK